MQNYNYCIVLSKGSVRSDHASQKNLLKTIWFTMYSRGGGVAGSSGFEHIFANEIKNNEISGLHNWIYFNDQENYGHNNLDYKGYLKSLHLGNVRNFLISLPLFGLCALRIYSFKFLFHPLACRKLSFSNIVLASKI